MVIIGFPSARVKIHYKTNVGRLFTEHVQPRPLDVDSLPTLFFLVLTKVLQRFALVLIGFPSVRVKIQHKTNVGIFSASSGSWREDFAQGAREFMGRYQTQSARPPQATQTRLP